MRYFNNVNTLEELRKQYKELLKKYHPDNPNGSTKATQEINAEYDNLFKVLKDRHEHKTEQTSDTDKKSYDNMKYDFSEDEKLKIKTIARKKGMTVSEFILYSLMRTISEYEIYELIKK